MRQREAEFVNGRLDGSRKSLHLRKENKSSRKDGATHRRREM